MGTSFSTFSYGLYAQQFLRIDETESGQLYAVVPGMGGDTFTVLVNEEGLVPVATHCRCQHFKHHGHCLHTEIVDSFYARIYKSNIAKSEQKALETAMDASEAIEEQYAMAEIANEVQATLQTNEAQAAIAEAQLIVTLSSIELAARKRAASLPRNQGFSILRR